MKKLFILFAVIGLSISAKASEPNPLVGTYTECVKWTTFSGVLTSKKFEVLYAEDKSVSLRIAMHSGNDKCDGEAYDAKVLSQFEIMKDQDIGTIRLLEVKKINEGLYLQFLFSANRVTVISSTKYPVEIEMNNFIFLTREQ